MIEQGLELGKWIIANGPAILNSVIALLIALIAVCMWIPGSQPEAALQKVVDFLAKFSKKPKV